MRSYSHKAPKLPRGLIDEIDGLQTTNISRRPRTGFSSRKERRKAERSQKKLQSSRAKNTPQLSAARGRAAVGHASSNGVIRRHVDSGQTRALNSPRPAQKPKAKKFSGFSEGDDTSTYPNAASSRRKHTTSAEDAEIEALEKKLGLKGKQKSSKPAADDFDDILGTLSDEDEDSQRSKRRSEPEDDEWLRRKRRKATKPSASDGDSMDDFLAEELGPDDEDDTDAFGSSRDSVASGLSGDDIEDSGASERHHASSKPRARENPYLPPVVDQATTATKYVPPALRKAVSSGSESSARLRRQIQGLLNRLSDANIITILNEIEAVFSKNPRQHVADTTVELLINLICNRAGYSDTFIILHACLVAGIYKLVGVGFGALVIERAVAQFDRYYSSQQQGDNSGKETINLMSFVAHLYTFQVIASNLIFDYVRMFLESLSELHTELLLRVIKDCGSQLRQDDPLSLKDIIFLLQKSVAGAGDTHISARTRFMIDTIKDLKNNRAKAGGEASLVASEHIIRLKKALGSFSTRSVRASEPLRVGLNDIRHSDKQGKWWLTGASWRKDDQAAQSVSHLPDRISGPSNEEDELIGGDDVDLVRMAKEHRMNTDIRRAIFITMMSASDYRDAYLRLMKLKLKRSQESEISMVLLHCAGAEEKYNPYYTLIAQKLCSHHRIKMAFQFNLWDLLKQIDNTDDNKQDFEEDDALESVSIGKIVNLAKMFGALIAHCALPLSVFKALKFAYMAPKVQTFTEVCLVSVILETQKRTKDRRDETKLLSVFDQAKDQPHMAQGLQRLLSTVISRTDIAEEGADRATVRWGCRVAERSLSSIALALINDDESGL